VFVKNSDKLVLLVLDGTWSEAKKMYFWSPPLKQLPKLKLDLSLTSKSQYVVKTQPNDECLSTVESVAYVLASLEQDQTILERLTKPLLALCSFQINHGAVKHDSKEFKRDIKDFTKENCRRH
jgi:DTW domain-containing protein YfiP